MTATHATATSTRAPLSVKNKVGLALCFLLALADVAAVATLGAPEGDEVGPPAGIVITGLVLGLVTLVTVVWTWRTGNRMGARVTAAARVVSALTAVPAFFVEDVAAALIVSAGATILLTVLAVGLMLAPARAE